MLERTTFIWYIIIKYIANISILFGLLLIIKKQIQQDNIHLPGVCSNKLAEGSSGFTLVVPVDTELIG